jgi:hypothetical protein
LGKNSKNILARRADRVGRKRRPNGSDPEARPRVTRKRPRRGGILNRGSEVVGLSNLFGCMDMEMAWRNLVAMAVEVFPGLPLVGYERGHELAAAHQVGFETVGLLRVWKLHAGGALTSLNFVSNRPFPPAPEPDRRRGGIIEHDVGVSKRSGRDASPALVGGPGRPIAIERNQYGSPLLGTRYSHAIIMLSAARVQP